MIPSFKHLLDKLILIPMLGISLISSAQTELMTEFHPVVKKKEIKNLNLEKGIHDFSFTLTNNEKWNLKMSVPEIGDGERVPLIVAMHWAGDGNAYKQFFDCLAAPGLNSLGGIIIAPSSNNLHWINAQNEHLVIDMVKKVIKYWPVSKDKIILMGYSNGAVGTWHYISNYPKLFQTGIALAGSYDRTKIDVPLYVLHGEQDELFDHSKVANSIKESIKRGSAIDFQTVAEKSHFMACDYVEELSETATKVKKEILGY